MIERGPNSDSARNRGRERKLSRPTFSRRAGTKASSGSRGKLYPGKKSGCYRPKRKRRLRLAEAAAYRRGLKGTLGPYCETAKVALIHLDSAGQSGRVFDAIRATAADTDEEIREIQEVEAMTRRALDLLGCRRKRKDAYKAALAALHEDTQDWWKDMLARDADGRRRMRSL